MALDHNDSLIVRSIVDLARSMQLETVAEGVESQEAWDLLKEMGCDLAQGFLVSAALSAEECTSWLRAHRVSHAPKSVPAVLTDRPHLRPVI
jgi:EAL domain-containing protein (putative c-di-GMP-specific phosphodiesterase class I)